MELDDLKSAWQELDRRVEHGIDLAMATRRELKLDQARTALGGLSATLWYELAWGALAALLLGAFLAAELTSLRFALPAEALLAAAVFVIAQSVRQIAWLGRIDF